MRFCPYAQRVRLILEAKRIPHDVVNINLKQKPDWFLRINPQGTVPVLQFPNGYVLTDSNSIGEYLDSSYAENKLTPYDYNQKYEHQSIMNGLSNLMSLLSSYNSSPSQYTAQNIESALEQYIERKLSSTYLGGYRPAMVDYLLWVNIFLFFLR
jgi:glutathione S-transferase